VPTEHAGPRVAEPIRRTLARNFTIAIVVGVAIAVVRRAPLLALPEALLALWPSLGGHFVEVAFLDGVRPRLPRARLVQASARLVWWLAGGALLGCALIATAHALPIGAPRWRWWWIGAPFFVGIELVVHAILALRSCPSFYRGDG
jgi:hypothetical protein